MSSAPEAELGGGLPLHADLMLEAAPPPPFDWVREGTSLWLFEENGAFGIPRIGVEAEPWTWDNRRYAANFAFANRHVLAQAAEEALLRVLGIGPSSLGWRLVYDVAHNVAKEETHLVDGERRRLLVHRKGATRAFPPGHPELPSDYRALGQPVLIPGDMGRYSFVLLGAAPAMTHTFGSTCHGAGRVMSRTAAVKAARALDAFDFSR